jgi:hypothetical protein
VAKAQVRPVEQTPLELLEVSLGLLGQQFSPRPPQGRHL